MPKRTVWLQPVAWALPPTYVFEGMRALLIQNVFRPDLMIDALLLNVVFFAGGLGRDHHQASVSNASLGNDVVGEMLHLGAGASQGRYFHAIVIVEVNVKRRHR